MTLLRVAQLRDAVGREQEKINDPRVFDEVMRKSMFAFESACADASYPAILDDPEVIAATDTLINGVVGLLYARSAGAKAYPWKLRAANREIDRAALAAHTALDNLNATVKKAMTARVGFDGTHEDWLSGLRKHFGEDS